MPSSAVTIPATPINAAGPPELENISTKPNDEDTAAQIGPFQRFLLAFVCSLAAFLISLNASLISVAVPTITTYFHSVNDIGWYGTVYLLADCSLQPLTGKIYQNCSLKWTFISFLSVFMIGNILCGAAQSSNMLIIARAIAGLGGSGISNGGMSIISVSTPLEKRPIAISGLMAAFALGMVIGPLIGGLITQHASWRWCFFTTTIAAGFVVLTLILSKVPDRASKKGIAPLKLLRKLDLIGFVIFAPSITMLLLATYYGGAAIYPWSSLKVIGLFCGFGAGLATFITWAWYRGEEAMIPLSFFNNRIIVASSLTGFFQMGSNIVVAFYLAIYFQSVKDASPSAAGVMILPLIMSQMVTSGIAGIFTQRVGYYLPPALVGCVMSAVGSGLFISFTPTTSESIWMGYQIIAGAGRGLVFQAPIMAAQCQLPASDTDVGTTFMLFTQFLGAALFVSFGQAVFSSALLNAIRTRLPDIDPALVINAGATGYRTVFADDAQVVEILRGCWSDAVSRTFILAAGGAGASLIACFWIGWKSVKGRKHGGDEEAVAETKFENEDHDGEAISEDGAGKEIRIGEATVERSETSDDEERMLGSQKVIHEKDEELDVGVER